MNKKLLAVAAAVLLVSLMTVPCFAAGESDNDYPSSVSDVSTYNPYQECYELFHQYVYGGAELSPAMELTLVQLSTFCCLLLSLMPFIFVIIVVRLFFWR